MRYWEGKTVQLSNVALLSFSNILSPELAIILELMSGFCALELGICFKSLTEKHEGNSFCRVPLANALKIKFNVSFIHGNKSGQLLHALKFNITLADPGMELFTYLLQILAT